MFAAACNN